MPAWSTAEVSLSLETHVQLDGRLTRGRCFPGRGVCSPPGGARQKGQGDPYYPGLISEARQGRVGSR